MERILTAGENTKVRAMKIFQSAQREALLRTRDTLRIATLHFESQPRDPQVFHYGGHDPLYLFDPNPGRYLFRGEIPILTRLHFIFRHTSLHFFIEKKRNVP